MDVFINAVTAEKSVIFFSQEKIEHEEIWTSVGTESVSLFTAFDAGMRALSIEPQDLGHIVVVSGPGAFTGLRIILTFVNTLSFLYPHIQVHPITAGNLCAAIFPSPLYVFAPYPSDVFIFDATGSLMQRYSAEEWQNSKEFHEEYAGIWPEDAALCVRGHRIEESAWRNITCLQKLRMYPVEKGYIEPLYAKHPNITKAKKL